MTHSKILLNDGSSAVLLNDGSSFVILNTAGEEHGEVSTGGTIASFRHKFRQVLQPPFLEHHTDFSLMIAVKPMIIATNDIVKIQAIPLLKQYTMKIVDIFLKPITVEDKTISRFTINPTKHKDVRIGFVAKPFEIKSTEVRVKVKPTLGDYYHTSITGTALNGINIIRKAMSLSKVRSFEFRESSREWNSADTLSDLDKRLDLLNEKLIDLEREVEPREKTFDQSSSFVGQVTYTPDLNTMEINLNGKVYGFCGVPERIFDAFEAAPSKGAYFGRSIRGQFNCG